MLHNCSSFPCWFLPKLSRLLVSACSRDETSLVRFWRSGEIWVKTRIDRGLPLSLLCHRGLLVACKYKWRLYLKAHHLTEAQIFISYSSQEQSAFAHQTLTYIWHVQLHCYTLHMHTQIRHKGLKIMKNLETWRWRLVNKNVSEIWVYDQYWISLWWILDMTNIQQKICIVKSITNIIITHVGTHFYPDVGFSYMCNPILSWAQYPLTKVPQKSISKCIYTYVYEIGEKKKPYNSRLKCNYYVSSSS